MRKSVFLTFLFIPLMVLAQNYYFFTSDDVSRMRSSAQTEWGGEIVDALKNVVSERHKSPMEVPLLEGGHLHHYFCPIHKIRFTFDWNKPTEHYCTMCMEYWKDEKLYDWGWVNVAHECNCEYLRSCMYLYLITGERQYAEYIRNMMLDYAAKYITYLEHDTERKVGPWGGKMFGQSLDESVWASEGCRAFQVAKEIMTDEEIAHIENGYLRPCAKLLLNRRGTANWQVWHNSGLAALGIALHDDKIIDVAINDGKHGYYAMMKEFVSEDGWWGEGSPTYHYYPLRAMLLTADAVRCRNINLYDEKLYKMLASPALGVYADLYFPAHNDGWYGESLLAQAPLYEIGYVRYNNDPFFKSVLEQCYQHIDRTSTEALENGVILQGYENEFCWPSIEYPNMGYSVLRSGKKTVILKYGPHGGGHGHPDKLSISIHNGIKEIVPDMGTCAYGIPEFTKWYRKTLAHSTVTVDAKDQNPSVGKLLHFRKYEDGAEAKAQANEAYPGVDMIRYLVFRDDKLKDRFTATSTELHQYDYVLILSERPDIKGEFKPIVLSNAPEYQYIKKTMSMSSSSAVVGKVGNETFTIRMLNGHSFELIVGKIPGIPPGNGKELKKYANAHCYVLIVRSKDTKLDIETEWTL